MQPILACFWCGRTWNQVWTGCCCFPSRIDYPLADAKPHQGSCGSADPELHQGSASAPLHNGTTSTTEEKAARRLHWHERSCVQCLIATIHRMIEMKDEHPPEYPMTTAALEPALPSERGSMVVWWSHEACLDDLTNSSVSTSPDAPRSQCPALSHAGFPLSLSQSHHGTSVSWTVCTADHTN
jgi:hypothetical protein